VRRIGALAVFTSVAWAQAPGIITSELRLVLVDTVVTDKKGGYVSGLTQKDFRVFEDNKEQTISSFSVESSDSAPRYTVLFFDNATAGPGETFARQAAAHFIENSADKHRLIAVAEYTTSLSVTQNFTTDLAKLRRAVASAKVPGARTATMPAAAQAAQDNYTMGNALDALLTVARGLSSLPGRKSIVFVSSGFPDSSTTAAGIAAAINACNKANVAIYPVASSIEQLKSVTPTGGMVDSAPATANTAGMRTAMRNGLTLDDSSSGAQQSLSSLATGTGGFMILNTTDLAAGFEKVGEEQQSYYLLGYVPSGSPRPGACHTLKVRLAKSGDTVRSRSGYCEAVALDALAGTPTERDLEAKLNASTSPDVTGAQMRAAFFYTGANEARVDLSLEVPADAIAFAKEKGSPHGVFNVIGIVGAEDGSPKSRFSDTVRQDVDDKKPLHYQKQFPMLPGQYTLKLVFSGAPGRFGRLEAPLAIDPWEPATFSLSGLALGVTARPAEGLLDADSGLVEDRVPLVAGGFEIVPSGTNVLNKSAKNFVYAEVYEPALAAPGAKESDIPAVGVRMDLIDAATGKVKKDFGLTRLRVPAPNGKTSIPIGLVLTAPELEAGAYKLRVTALDAKGHAAVRVTGIRLQ
jgi:VWFA-related protein